LGFTLTLPVTLSVAFFLPFAQIVNLTSPGAVTLLLITAELATLMPLPDPVSSPGLGTVAVRVAVPFDWLRVTAPRVNVFVGTTTAVALTRPPVSRKNPAVSPRPRPKELK
jgi:hypothetical protein